MEKKVKFNIKKRERKKTPRQTQFGFIIFFLNKNKIEKNKRQK
jgi:hypothetical protein